MQPAEWPRLYVSVLTISLIASLPIFLTIMGLLGRAVSAAQLRGVFLGVRRKIFLVGMLMPLLANTILVQYYWIDAEGAGFEAVVLWTTLALIAVYGSTMLASNLGRALYPLEKFLSQQGRYEQFDNSVLQPQSIDELGVLTSQMRQLTDRLKLQGEILDIRNLILSSGIEGDYFKETFVTIIDLCDSVMRNDVSFILLSDDKGSELVDVIHTGVDYRQQGYYRLPTNSMALSALAYKAGRTLVVADAQPDERVGQQVVLDMGARSAIATPLRIGNHLLGVLVSTSTETHRSYDERDKILFEALAQEAALVVHALILHEKQRKAEQRYQELNALAPDPILLLSDAGHVLEANQAAQSLLGLSDHELSGRQLHTIVQSESDSTDIQSQLLAAKSGEASAFRVLLDRASGEQMIIEAHAARIMLAQTSVIQVFMRDITKRQQYEDILHHSQKELSTILDSMQDTFYRINLRGRLMRLSPSVSQLLGYKPDELVGRSVKNIFVHQDGYKKFIQELKKNDGRIHGYQLELRRKDGNIVWASINAHYYPDASNTEGIEGTARDMTAFVRAQDELFREKERAQVTLASIGDGVITTNIQGRIEYMNPVAEHMCGWTLDEASGHMFDDIFVLLDEASRRVVDSPIQHCLKRRHTLTSQADTILVGQYGMEYAVEYSIAAIRGQDNDIVGTVIGLHDITEMRRMARQLSHQASHDALTGLINRREFELRLQRALDSARETEGQHALCYLDLDQFKIVNDTCGHIAGDELLKQISEKLRMVVRKADTLARLGGDEFGVLLWNCDLDTASEIADSLRKAVREFRFSWQDRAFDIGVSIGLVPITAASGNLTDVLSAADSACYVAKDHGRNRVHVYVENDELLAQRHGEMQWVSRLHAAIEENRLLLYGQRIISVRGDVDEGRHWEVLVRMRSDDGKIIPPMAFIPAAERYHLMPLIDRWVVRQALSILEHEQIRTHHANLLLNINLSGQSLSDNELLDFVIEEIEQRDIDPSHVCFEITETSAIANLTQASSFISVLEGLGCSFALDDFGSGLSSFGYLKNLNVDYLKIDGSFIRDINDDPIDYAMVESINNIGHTLGLKTVAEFVETDEIMARLLEIGVDMAQGYAIDVPKPLYAAIVGDDVT